MLSVQYGIYTYTVTLPSDRRLPPRWEKMPQFSVVWLTAQHFLAFKSHLSLHITFCNSSSKAETVLNAIALIHLECVWANSWMVFKSYTVPWGMCACVCIYRTGHTAVWLLFLLSSALASGLKCISHRFDAITYRPIHKGYNFPLHVTCSAVSH